MEFSKLMPDAALGKNGAWLTFRPPTHQSEAFEVLVGYGLNEFNEALEKRFIEVRRLNDGRNLSHAQRVEAINRARYGTMVRGWRNVQHDGVDLPFTEDNLYQLLTNYPPFEAWLLDQVPDVRNFQAKPDADNQPEGAAKTQAENFQGSRPVEP